MKTALLICLLGTGLSAPFPLQGFPAHKHKPSQPKKYNQQPYSDAYVLMALQFDSIEPSQHQGQSDENKGVPEKKGFDLEFWTFCVNVGLVLATLVLAIFSVIQANAAKGSADAAEETAKTTNKQVEIVMLSERPWIILAPEDGFILKPSNRFDWVIINKGRTVARILEAAVVCRKIDFINHLPDIPEYKRPILLYSTPLTPNNTLQVWSYIGTPEGETTGITAEQVEEIQTKNIADLVAYGRVNYLDSFGEPHESRFCYYYAAPFKDFRIYLETTPEYHNCD